MEIFFADRKLQKQCQSARALQKAHGITRARRILRHLNVLIQASTLADIRHSPGRCHELTGDRAGQFALDLDHPYRLIFIPEHDPTPRKEDGGINWQEITRVTILAVEDYH